MGQPPRREQEETFTRLIEPHFDRLFRLAARLTGSRPDAEDLVQETLTRLYADLTVLDAVVDHGTYLSRVLYNRFVDGHRARKRRPLTLVADAAELDQLDDSADPARLDDAARRARRLEQALARLGDEHRTLMLLHDAEGYTLRELEEMTGTPIGTLKSRLSRARARLRDLLWDLTESGNGSGKKREPFSAGRRVGE